VGGPLSAGLPCSLARGWREAHRSLSRIGGAPQYAESFSFVTCHGFLAYAQQHVPSGLSAILLATIPFWIALLSTVTSCYSLAEEITSISADFVLELRGFEPMAIASAVRFRAISLFLRSPVNARSLFDNCDPHAPSRAWAK
jgi:hypothetical protein